MGGHRRHLSTKIAVASQQADCDVVTVDFELILILTRLSETFVGILYKALLLGTVLICDLQVSGFFLS